MKNPNERLGAGPRDAEEIKDHEFFKGINWDELLALKSKPPFYPKIVSPHSSVVLLTFYADAALLITRYRQKILQTLMKNLRGRRLF